MSKILIYIISFLSVFVTIGQETTVDNDQSVTVLDSLYREDQFYFGVTFNLLLNRPNDVSQSGFSGGVHLGFIRDMPINKKRNVAIGLGIGYSLNVYNHNLFIGEEETSEQSVFRRLKGVDFNTNRFSLHLIEAPLEFRWRTSTPETHKFYRIYTGFKLGYLAYFNSNFKQSDLQIRQTKVDELNRWRIGTIFTFGWNTFNFHFYYSLNALFNDKALIDGQDKVGINTAKIGLVFYIL